MKPSKQSSEGGWCKCDPRKNYKIYPSWHGIKVCSDCNLPIKEEYE